MTRVERSGCCVHTPWEYTSRRRARRLCQTAHFRPCRSVHVAAVDAPWGPVHLAAGDRGLVAVRVDDRRSSRSSSGSSGASGREVVARRRHPVLDEAVRPARGRSSPIADARSTCRSTSRIGRPGTRPSSRAVERSAVGHAWRATARSPGPIDRPGAARAVGGAVARSPIGIVVPCHRIIAGDGSLGGYGGDWFGSRERHLRLKRELLLREGVDIPLPRG